MKMEFLVLCCLIRITQEEKTMLPWSRRIGHYRIDILPKDDMNDDNHLHPIFNNCRMKENYFKGGIKLPRSALLKSQASRQRTMRVGNKHCSMMGNESKVRGSLLRRKKTTSSEEENDILFGNNRKDESIPIETISTGQPEIETEIIYIEDEDEDDDELDMVETGSDHKNDLIIQDDDLDVSQSLQNLPGFRLVETQKYDNRKKVCTRQDENENDDDEKDAFFESENVIVHRTTQKITDSLEFVDKNDEEYESVLRRNEPISEEQDFSDATKKIEYKNIMTSTDLILEKHFQLFGGNYVSNSGNKNHFEEEGDWTTTVDVSLLRNRPMSRKIVVNISTVPNTSKSVISSSTEVEASQPNAQPEESTTHTTKSFELFDKIKEQLKSLVTSKLTLSDLGINRHIVSNNFTVGSSVVTEINEKDEDHFENKLFEECKKISNSTIKSEKKSHELRKFFGIVEKYSGNSKKKIDKNRSNNVSKGPKETTKICENITSKQVEYSVNLEEMEKLFLTADTVVSSEKVATTQGVSVTASTVDPNIHEPVSSSNSFVERLTTAVEAADIYGKCTCTVSQSFGFGPYGSNVHPIPPNVPQHPNIPYYVPQPSSTHVPEFERFIPHWFHHPTAGSFQVPIDINGSHVYYTICIGAPTESSGTVVTTKKSKSKATSSTTANRYFAKIFHPNAPPLKTVEDTPHYGFQVPGGVIPIQNGWVPWIPYPVSISPMMNQHMMLNNTPNLPAMIYQQMMLNNTPKLPPMVPPYYQHIVNRPAMHSIPTESPYEPFPFQKIIINTRENPNDLYQSIDNKGLKYEKIIGDNRLPYIFLRNLATKNNFDYDTKIYHEHFARLNKRPEDLNSKPVENINLFNNLSNYNGNRLYSVNEKRKLYEKLSKLINKVKQGRILRKKEVDPFYFNKTFGEVINSYKNKLETNIREYKNEIQYNKLQNNIRSSLRRLVRNLIRPPTTADYQLDPEGEKLVNALRTFLKMISIYDNHPLNDQGFNLRGNVEDKT